MEPPQLEYVTAAVERGDFEAPITATGNLRGRDTVEVSAEVSGTVSAVHVDFNDEVTKGQILCEIDSKELASSLKVARAQLAAARASSASANTTSKEAALRVRHKRALMEKRLVSRQDLEAALAAAERAKAAARSAKAQIALSIASVELAQTKLRKAQIRAPFDGVVLTRSVEVGRTVAASQHPPVLFTVARNLRQLELTVAIDEANIEQLVGTKHASFTIDAFPDRDFVAELRSTHNVATERDGAVSYDALFAVMIWRCDPG